jgi:glycosyltransferase involved in cell wall biosynthesis
MQQAIRQKVAHLTSVHVPSDTRICYRECATLAEAGYDVALIAPGEAPVLPPGVRFRGVPAAHNRFERMTRTVLSIYAAARRERADIYHFHDPELMGVGLLLRAGGARVVFDVHEDIPQDIADKVWIPPPLRSPIAAASALVLRALQHWYSAVVTATPAIARRFHHSRTVVVCNYPRIEELPASDPSDFSQRGLAAVYLGEITQLRCIDEMLAALDSPEFAQDMRLILAGRFEDGALERRVKTHRAWSRVEYLGYCPRSKVAGVLASARVGMLLFRRAANHDEALPTKLFEYLGAGLPVIISDTLRCSDIVREHDCGLVVDPNDADAVARAMAFLIDNPATAQAMGERGRRLVTERYQWKSEATKLTRLYAEIA